MWWRRALPQPLAHPEQSALVLMRDRFALFRLGGGRGAREDGGHGGTLGQDFRRREDAIRVFWERFADCGRERRFDEIAKGQGGRVRLRRRIGYILESSPSTSTWRSWLHYLSGPGYGHHHQFEKGTSCSFPNSLRKYADSKKL